METTTSTTRQFTFGFVQCDKAKNSYFVKEVDDFEPIDVDESETFEQAVNGTDLIETMQSDWFDEVVTCHWVDDTLFENGMIRLQGGKTCWRDDASTMDFGTEDIRDQVELPDGVCGDEARFVIFTNGDGEDDILEWGVFFPRND